MVGYSTPARTKRGWTPNSLGLMAIRRKLMRIAGATEAALPRVEGGGSRLALAERWVDPRTRLLTSLKKTSAECGSDRCAVLCRIHGLRACGRRQQH